MFAIAPVLIVEDHDIVRRVVKQQCTRLGYPTLEAATVEDAIHKVSTESLSAMILDIQLPGHSGLEFAELVRKVQPDGAVPIFIFTGVVLSDPERALAKRLHASVFHKPGELSALVDAVDCYLNPESPVSGLSTCHPAAIPEDQALAALAEVDAAAAARASARRDVA